MSSPAFGGVAAIVGIGQTEFSRRAGRSELQLACESITAALADAGLRPADVDGLVSYTVDPVEETELVRSVGFPEIAFSSRIPYGGGGSMGVLLHAASAVASGVADVVVGYRAARRLRRLHPRKRACRAPGRVFHPRGAAHRQARTSAVLASRNLCDSRGR